MDTPAPKFELAFPSWPTPTREDPAARRPRAFTVACDVGWLDSIERATQMGINELVGYYSSLIAAPDKLRAGVQFRMVLGSLQSVDPTVTYEQLREALPAGQLFDVSSVIGKPFADFTRLLAAGTPETDADPTAGDASGAGQSSKPASPRTPPGGSAQTS